MLYWSTGKAFPLRFNSCRLRTFRCCSNVYNRGDCIALGLILFIGFGRFEFALLPSFFGSGEIYVLFLLVAKLFYLFSKNIFVFHKEYSMSGDKNQNLKEICDRFRKGIATLGLNSFGASVSIKKGRISFDTALLFIFVGSLHCATIGALPLSRFP